MYKLDSIYTHYMYCIYHIFYIKFIYTYSLLYKVCFSIGKCSGTSSPQNII